VQNGQVTDTHKEKKHDDDANQDDDDKPTLVHNLEDFEEEDKEMICNMHIFAAEFRNKFFDKDTPDNVHKPSEAEEHDEPKGVSTDPNQKGASSSDSPTSQGTSSTANTSASTAAAANPAGGDLLDKFPERMPNRT